MRPQFVVDFACVIEHRRFIADSEDAHLFGREPEREITGVMLDQESDEPFMCSQWRAMNADRNLVDVVAVFIAKIKTARLREIDLVRRDGKLTSDHAPRLHVDLRAVKGRFVRHFDIINSRIL
jgi:hypothetical protein